MDKVAAEEFTQTVEQHLGASWRQMAWALQQGVPQALGLTDVEWGKRIAGRVRLDVEERRKAVLELRHQDKMTVQEIAVALGVGHATVERDLASFEVKPKAELPVSDPKPEQPASFEAKSLSTAELLDQLKAHAIDVSAILKSQEEASAEAAVLKAQLEQAVKPEPVKLTKEQMLAALKADGLDVNSIEAARVTAQEKLKQLREKVKDPELAKAVLKKAGIDVGALLTAVETIKKPPVDLSGVQVHQSPEMSEAKSGLTALGLAQEIGSVAEKLESRYRHLQPLPEAARPHEGLAKASARLVAVGERFSKYAASGLPDTDQEFWEHD